jgi:hypothetical protein
MKTSRFFNNMNVEYRPGSGIPQDGARAAAASSFSSLAEDIPLLAHTGKRRVSARGEAGPQLSLSMSRKAHFSILVTALLSTTWIKLTAPKTPKYSRFWL